MQEGENMGRQRNATILCTIGTRPEAIKMAPVIRAFQDAPWARCRVLFTAQHRELVDQMLGFFEIEPDIDLDIMRPDQSLVELTSRLLLAVHDAIARERPDMVLAQGDTTTVLRHGAGELLPQGPLRPRRGRPAHRPALGAVPRGRQPGPGGTSRRPALRPDGRRPRQPAPRGDRRGFHRRHRQHRDRRPAAGRRPRRADRR